MAPAVPWDWAEPAWPPNPIVMTICFASSAIHVAALCGGKGFDLHRGMQGSRLGQHLRADVRSVLSQPLVAFCLLPKLPLPILIL